MSGNDVTGSWSKREIVSFLAELAVMRVVDREQAKIVAGFGSTTRANARLLALTRAGLLRRFFLGTTGAGQKALYAFRTRERNSWACRSVHHDGARTNRSSPTSSCSTSSS